MRDNERGHAHDTEHAHAHTHGHDHGHAHPHAEGEDHASEDHAGHDHGALPSAPRIAVGLALALAAEMAHLLVPDAPTARWGGMALAAVAIALTGLGIYRSGIRSLLRGQLGISALMAVAVTGAFAIGQWPEAAMVMALYALAERIEERAAARARNAIGALLALSPDTAELQLPDGRWKTVDAADIAVGSVVRVRPGARVPLDGTVTAGHGAVDESTLTGESLPVDKAPGDALYAGTLNTHAELQLRTSAAAGSSALDRVIAAVEDAQARRAPLQRLVERFARVYTPAVFVLALAVALGMPLLAGWGWLQALYRALVLLVIACPCALVLATPVTVVSALAAAARRGILVKGGDALERARALRVVAFDKTGTITTGRPTLVLAQALRAAGSVPGASQALRAAAALAARSDHPVSRAVAAGLLHPATPPDEVARFQDLPGRGVQGEVFGRTWHLGNRRLMEEAASWSDEAERASAAQTEQGRSVTLLACEGTVHAVFAVADTLRPEARSAIAALRELRMEPVMLTGDHGAAAWAVARQVGIAQVRHDLLPQDKQAVLAELQAQRGRTAMAGDGVNDAPALAASDLGIAMGAVGSDVAMETADVVIMNDDLHRVAETVRLARRTHAVLWQNIAIALGIKAACFGLALAGVATMWMAVFADMGASLLVIANGLRMRRAEHPTGGPERPG